MDAFCRRLKELRGDQSQLVFAKKLGLSQVTYGRYELGQREPDLDTLVRIGLVMGVSTDWLLGIDDIKPDQAEASRKLQALKQAISSIIAEF